MPHCPPAPLRHVHGRTPLSQAAGRSTSSRSWTRTVAPPPRALRSTSKALRQRSLGNWFSRCRSSCSLDRSALPLGSAAPRVWEPWLRCSPSRNPATLWKQELRYQDHTACTTLHPTTPHYTTLHHTTLAFCAFAGLCVCQKASLASELALALASKFPIIPEGVLWEWLSANGLWGLRSGTMGNYAVLWGVMGKSWLNYGELWGVMRNYGVLGAFMSGLLLMLVSLLFVFCSFLQTCKMLISILSTMFCMLICHVCAKPPGSTCRKVIWHRSSIHNQGQWLRHGIQGCTSHTFTEHGGC